MKEMKKIPYIFILVLLALSCQKQVPLSVDDCQRSYSFEAEGGTVFATVFGSETFTVTSTQDWCYVQAYKPGNDNNLRITARANANAQERDAVVTVTCEGSAPIEIKVKQSPADAYIKCSPATVSLKDTDTEFDISVSANTAYTVSTSDWIVFDPSQTTGIGTYTLHFTVTGSCPAGSKRNGNVTFTSPAITVQEYVEQATWETVTMMWGLEDIKYIWQAFGNVKTAINPTVIAGKDFAQYPKIKKAEENAGFIYTNDSGALTVAISNTGEFKINKAGSKTSTGNIDRDGNNSERMQMSKATAGKAENAFVFTAPRTGSLEIEAASPSSGDKKPMVMVDGKDYQTFAAGYKIPSDITTMDIVVTDPEKGAEVRIYGTGGAINYFRITYTYQKPVD